MADKNQINQVPVKPIYKKSWFWAAVVVVVLVIWLIGTYNNFISMSIGIDNSWANVQAQYQRRFDLIPRLVNATQAYAQFERSTLTEITQLRTQWLSASTVDQKIQIAQQTDTALARLVAVFEAYPQLRTVEPLRALQDELSGTENRIAVARMDYNAAVAKYNAGIRYFPGSAVAGMFGFTEKTFFNATTQAQNPVDIPSTL